MVGWLFGSARRRYLEAARLLNVETDPVRGLINKTTFDHRTLQDAHDLIAAYYRFAHDDGGQLRLDENDRITYSLRLWRAWERFCQREVKDLLQDDEFTLAVLTATVYENQKDGYAAETRIRLFLEDRYSEMNRSRT